MAGQDGIDATKQTAVATSCGYRIIGTYQRIVVTIMAVVRYADDDRLTSSSKVIVADHA